MCQNYCWPAKQQKAAYWCLWNSVYMMPLQSKITVILIFPPFVFSFLGLRFCTKAERCHPTPKKHRTAATCHKKTSQTTPRVTVHPSSLPQRTGDWPDVMLWFIFYILCEWVGGCICTDMNNFMPDLWDSDDLFYILKNVLRETGQWVHTALPLQESLLLCVESVAQTEHQTSE